MFAPAGRHSAVPLKYYDTSAAHIQQSVEDSLRLMGITEIDLLLIHRPDPFMNHHETGAVLDKLVTAGKVKAVGVSNFKPHDWNLLQSVMQNKLCDDQIEMSVLTNQAFTNGDLAFLQERGIPPMAWSPLAGGALFTKENAPLTRQLQEKAEEAGVEIGAVAIAWLLAHPAQILPVLGTNNLNRIHQISDAFKVSMDRINWFALYQEANGHEVP